MRDVKKAAFRRSLRRPFCFWKQLTPDFCWRYTPGFTYAAPSALYQGGQATLPPQDRLAVVTPPLQRRLVGSARCADRVEQRLICKKEDGHRSAASLPVEGERSL
jgi:hypothetical protein